MPSPIAFRKGFGLDPGTTVLEDEKSGARFELVDVKVGHDVVKTYQEYRFPTVLRFVVASSSSKTTKAVRNSSQDANAIIALLKKLFEDNNGAIVYSQYGSPYECKYDVKSVAREGEDDDKRPEKKRKSEEETITITCNGVAVRRRDIPKQGEEEAAKVRAAESDEVKAELEKRGGFRVMRSRFSTGKCAKCNSTILSGTRIARREGGARSGSGGWMHEACAYEMMRGEANASPSSRKRKSEESKEESGDEASSTKRRKRAARRG